MLHIFLTQTYLKYNNIVIFTFYMKICVYVCTCLCYIWGNLRKEKITHYNNINYIINMLILF